MGPRVTPGTTSMTSFGFTSISYLLGFSPIQFLLLLIYDFNNSLSIDKTTNTFNLSCNIVGLKYDLNNFNFEKLLLVVATVIEIADRIL